MIRGGGGSRILTRTLQSSLNALEAFLERAVGDVHIAGKRMECVRLFSSGGEGGVRRRGEETVVMKIAEPSARGTRGGLETSWRQQQASRRDEKEAPCLARSERRAMAAAAAATEYGEASNKIRAWAEGVTASDEVERGGWLVGRAGCLALAMEGSQQGSPAHRRVA
ncbi:unnamed protein product [Lampetra fluviatilis]